MNVNPTPASASLASSQFQRAADFSRVNELIASPSRLDTDVDRFEPSTEVGGALNFAKIAEVRQLIQNGQYDTEARLDGAVDALFDTLI